MRSSIFYEFISSKMEKVFITLLLVSQIMVSGISSFSVMSVTSFLGDEKDFIQFSYYAGIIGNMAIYPLIGRLSRYFLKRHIILVCILLELLLSALIIFSINDLQLFICNFLLSSVKMICLITCIGMFMQMANPSSSRGLFYGIYYAISFSLNQLYAYIAAIVLLNHSWQYSFIIAVPGMCISLLIAIFAMHSRRTERRYPLYQIDWLGYFLFVIFGLSVAYVCIYGERLQWLEENSIRVAFIISLLSLILWILRMMRAKRPYIRIDALIKYPHITWGVSLMVMLYFVYNTFNISTEFMKVNLAYDDVYVARTNLYMVLSFIIVIPLTGIWLHHHHRAREPLFVGFLLFAVYYFYTAGIFYPEENTGFFLFPMVLRSAAYSICITTLSYYASVNVPADYNSPRAFFSISSRNVLALPVTSALLQDRFNYAKLRHITFISSEYTPDEYRFYSLWKESVTRLLKNGNSPEVAESLSQQSIRNGIYKQAVIMGSQDIYYILGAVSIILAVSVLFINVLNIHYRKTKNEYPLTHVNMD